MRRQMLLPVLAALLVSPVVAFAQQNTVDPALLRGMKYRQVGPPRGGRVTPVTGVPSQPQTFYMGVASGGVFRTTNSGQSWEPITDGQIPLGSIGDIAVALSDPNTIYVGTGSDGVRSNVSTGRGVYKSTDNGKTWQFAGLRDAGQIGAVRIHPTNPNIVWVAAYGDIFKKNTERGVFKTADGGRTWKKTLFLNDSTGAMDIELMPGNPDVVYAWMNRTERKPWTIISGSREGGFWKSTNGGETFTKITNGLPTGLVGKGNMGVTAANPQRIYALVEALPGGNLYRSDDAGQSWQPVNCRPNTSGPTCVLATPGIIQRPFYYTTLGTDHTNADVVYVGAEGFWKSSDGGKTLTSLRTPHGDNHDIWVNPTNGRIMVQANDGGANVSTDGGQTWSTQMNQVTSEIYQVFLDNKFPYNLYGAQQDNSTIITSMTANPMDPNAFQSGPGCETGPILPHPKDPDIVYGSCKGQYEVYNAKSGTTRPYWIGGQSLYGNPGKDLILRFQRTSPMATSPHDPTVLYYGSQKVHRTRDLGVTWETISPDLTWNPPHAQGASGEPITRDVTGEEFYSTLYAITESPHEAGVIWTGANDGPFNITRDGGKTWKNITPKELQPGGRVTFIEHSPHRRGSAYYTVHRYLLGDYKPYIYLTNDYGATWKLLTTGTNGIAADNPARIVREDPDREGLLYAGTEFGMYISFNNGTTWQPFFLNMPQIPINDIKVHKKDLVIATQGRGFWIFDNVTVLHQLAQQQQATNQTMLYKPRDGYRTSVSPTILGPTIDYYLAAPATGPVVIEIQDARGNAISRYDSNAPAAVQASGRGGRGGGGGDPDDDMMVGRPGRGGGGPVSRVTANVGQNRFVWDGRHSLTQGTPVAVPGRYTAVLKVNNQEYKQPFNLLIDPRVAEEGITVADLQELFDHNARVAALNTEVGALLRRLQDAQRQAPEGSDKRKAIDAVLAKIQTEPVRYGKPGLQAHISYLGGLGRPSGGTDMKVGRDAIDRYNVLRKELDAVKAEADRALGPG